MRDRCLDFIAFAPTDPRLAPLQALACEHRMTAVVGAPLSVGGPRPGLGAVVFGPDSVGWYCKMHLGSGERPHFTPGNVPFALSVEGRKIGLAICADASDPSHPQGYADAGASIYAAGVFLNAEWYAGDAPRLAGYAVKPGLLVVMANQAAPAGTYTSVGRSAVWLPGGSLLAEAAGAESCLVVAVQEGTAWTGTVCPLSP